MLDAKAKASNSRLRSRPRPDTHNAKDKNGLKANAKANVLIGLRPVNVIFFFDGYFASFAKH